MKIIFLVAISMPVSSSQSFTQKRNTLPIHKHWSGSQSGVEKAEQKILKTEKDWKKLWKTIHANVSPKPKLPKVDFQKHSVIAVFMGQKPTAGYSTKIEKLRKRKNVFVVSYRETTPRAGEITATVITTPYDLALIDRITGTVGFKKAKNNNRQ